MRRGKSRILYILAPITAVFFFPFIFVKMARTKKGTKANKPAATKKKPAAAVALQKHNLNFAEKRLKYHEAMAKKFEKNKKAFKRTKPSARTRRNQFRCVLHKKLKSESAKTIVGRDYAHANISVKDELIVNNSGGREHSITLKCADFSTISTANSSVKAEEDAYAKFLMHKVLKGRAKMPLFEQQNTFFQLAKYSLYATLEKYGGLSALETIPKKKKKLIPATAVDTRNNEPSGSAAVLISSDSSSDSDQLDSESLGTQTDSGKSLDNDLSTFKRGASDIERRVKKARHHSPIYYGEKSSSDSGDEYEMETKSSEEY